MAVEIIDIDPQGPPKRYALRIVCISTFQTGDGIGFGVFVHGAGKPVDIRIAVYAQGTGLLHDPFYFSQGRTPCKQGAAETYYKYVPEKGHGLVFT
jgi:hypothetical protein